MSAAAAAATEQLSPWKNGRRFFLKPEFEAQIAVEKSTDVTTSGEKMQRILG